MLLLLPLLLLLLQPLLPLLLLLRESFSADSVVFHLVQSGDAALNSVLMR